jgi:hypothetical protein
VLPRDEACRERAGGDGKRSGLNKVCGEVDLIGDRTVQRSEGRDAGVALSATDYVR